MCVVLMLCVCVAVGPIQHGAGVLAAAGQRWSFSEEHDGAVSAHTPAHSAWEPPQTGNSQSTVHSLIHAAVYVDRTSSTMCVISSCQRFYRLSQWMMLGSWRPWGDAGRKTSTCCVHIQRWLCGITTTVLTVLDSTGQSHTHKTDLTSVEVWRDQITLWRRMCRRKMSVLTLRETQWRHSALLSLQLCGHLSAWCWKLDADEACQYVYCVCWAKTLLKPTNTNAEVSVMSVADVLSGFLSFHSQSTGLTCKAERCSCCWHLNWHQLMDLFQHYASLCLCYRGNLLVIIMEILLSRSQVHSRTQEKSWYWIGLQELQPSQPI